MLVANEREVDDIQGLGRADRDEVAGGMLDHRIEPTRQDEGHRKASRLCARSRSPGPPPASVVSQALSTVTSDHPQRETDISRSASAISLPSHQDVAWPRLGVLSTTHLISQPLARD